MPICEPCLEEQHDQCAGEDFCSCPHASHWGLPWKPTTPQVAGRRFEQAELKRMGARAHPNSGAGKIKQDGSTDAELIEVKLANKTYSMKGSELEEVLDRALRQGKEAVFVVAFSNPRVILRGTINRRRDHG